MADGVAITAGSGTTIATDDVSSVHYQRVKLVDGTLDSTAAIPGDASNGLDVDVTRLPALVEGTAYVGKVRLTDGTNDSNVSTTGALYVGGAVAHDGVDSGNPVKLGMRAVSHGASPSPVAAADRTDLIANRAGVPFVIGGGPNILTLRHTVITTAVTNATIISGAANTRIVVTGFTVTLDNASTGFPSVLIGFGTTTTPTTTQVIGSHPGVPAGGGFSRGDGSGILGISAAADNLLVTTVNNATGNGLHIVVTYYTIVEA